MIDLTKLNPALTYQGYNIGKGTISSTIQYCSRKEAEQYKIPTNKIATHSFGLFFENGEWFVAESHLSWNGCKLLTYDKWIKDYDPESIFCFPYELNVDTLKFYCHPEYNPGYSIAEITGLALEDIFDRHFWNNNPGFTCSEFQAIASKCFQISYKIKLPVFRTKPVHYQVYQLVNNL